MIATPPTMTVPLRTDEHGTIRIADTRVTLEVVVASFQEGETPEQINSGFPTLNLADIYAIISYYLSHKDEVDAYLRQQDEEAGQIRREIEAKRPDMFKLQARLRDLLSKTE